MRSEYSHTIDGLFWFDLPLGILLTFIYHNVVRDCMLDNLPRIVRARLAAYKHRDWNTYFIGNWIVVTLSILIGALSHIVWDSLTHESGFIVQ